MTGVSKYKVFLFVLVTMLLLGVSSYVIPKDGVDLGFMRLNFFLADKLWFKKPIVQKDISQIVQSVDTTLAEGEKSAVVHQGKSKGDLGAPKSGGGAKISWNSEGNSVQMNSFFETLASLAESKKKVRILHFGDSQIEGDRMTAFIRQRLQERYGGFGPGMIPANNVYPTNSYKQTVSENFTRFTCFGGEKLSSRKYGLMNSVARFTPENKPTTDTSVVEAWIEISPSKSAYGRSRTYNNVKMFYNSCFEECALQVFQNDVLIHETKLETDGKYHSLPLSFPGSPGKLRYVFKGRISPNIMGFSLEGDYGIQMDNIAMRGSSGTFFGSIDRTLFAQQMADLGTEMIIMQFGGNSMPFLKDKPKVETFANYIKGQLKTLKKLRPNAFIVFIGPSDMSTLVDGAFQTYGMLPYCVEQLKLTTKSLGIPYFDLFEAMGGENSMPAWVEKGLAGKDHIHFSPKGASIASQLFYDALFNQPQEK